ncbi:MULTISPECIES: bacteriohemerythrin [unclassified Campylobacter]|uniref:bacteriohemerythrin n=1 Tax=unclassified Campylobacter TaxID=2593542 RepID=UPI001237B09D|nr:MULTISPECIES: bacteriohemerythrin [unclassified Campylobacter]KAA6224977.1 bacteriohemerythrin [Campylobacter sp. LR196d]KAA6225299.1 bacteriohemerythrin [Campylobacter sp. LR286c]KAA6225582.1 bacteriohemerythrin [Campylobacter sp. LR185c]KAA6230424.1 bacteriohemerythrin [Campylobacter sp. LR291e]KAA8604830.1 hemerythrin family non-heme iron protein [Campylobacter sp. LR185c]
MLPRWDNSFSVHNAKVDEQHKKLFELAAKVENISDRAVSKVEVKELLAEFFNYMKDHFSDEEKYMQLIDFPGLEEHRKIHKEIIQMMINLIKDIKSTNDLKEKLYVIAKKWLLEHILYEDMKVAKWRREALATDDGGEVSFETSEEDTVAEFYLYTCDCAGKIHDVPYGIHKKIDIQGKVFTCKTCGASIRFYKKQA